jgi:coniferyl-aldehyde dehydrogenase
MNVPVNSRSIDIPTEFQSCFDKQRAAYLAAPEPSYAQRIADLKSLTRLLKDNKDELVAAINADYGNRSEFETLFAEYFVVLEAVADAVKHLKKWMKPQRRHVDFMTYPLARNRVIPQPLGVVGVIVPWNFPLNLSFCPLATILAAGNRAMVKMSENSKALAKVLMRVSPKYFPIEKLAFFEDGGGRGPGFSSLPFDHLLFTGSGATGRSVMANAARNLTPVTLELGGKAPAIVGPDFPVKTAAERILWVKMFNAGQICTNVDYMFLPKGVRTSSSAIAGDCLPSASRTSTARTTRRSSMNGLSRGCRRRWRMPVQRARSWSILRNSRFQTRSVANLHRISC